MGGKRINVPPCFIIVCQNTAISKLVYDFVSGFHRKNSDGTTTLQNTRFGLFRNFDETTGNPLPRPNTLLIDSEQLEAGDALDDNFRAMAADEIDRFRRDIVERTGDARAGDNISEQDLLREVMNTVGKHGQLGGSIRCVVSVSMLTEGWDANTVTHVLGIRAFGTQLLCEQVIGRALRRQSYDLNEEGLFNVEYADIFGIPFDFTAKPVIAPPQPPRETVQVKAISPDRDSLEIRFPRVEGYRVELPEERLTADFNDDSVLELSPDLVGPSITQMAGIIGEGVDMSLEGQKFSLRFLLTEWNQVVDAWQLRTWDAYRDVARLGRKTRLPRRAAQTAVVHLRASSIRPEFEAIDHLAGTIYLLGREDRRSKQGRVRFRGGGRGAGCQSFPSPIYGSAGRGPTQRAVLRRGSGPAHLSATVLLEVARC
jgi:hypothetical protein